MAASNFHATPVSPKLPRGPGYPLDRNNVTVFLTMVYIELIGAAATAWKPLQDPERKRGRRCSVSNTVTAAHDRD